MQNMTAWPTTTAQIYIYIDKKDTVVPVHATKAYRERRGTAPFIRNLGNRLMSG
jgi:hypothetical protein